MLDPHSSPLPSPSSATSSASSSIAVGRGAGPELSASSPSASVAAHHTPRDGLTVPNFHHPALSRGASFDAMTSGASPAARAASPSRLRLSSSRSSSVSSAAMSNSRSAQTQAGTGPCVVIKCPSPDALNEIIPDQRIRLSLLHNSAEACTIGHLKAHISSVWSGKPSVQGLRFIRNGRLCADNELVLATTPKASSSKEAPEALEDVTLHLVVRSDAWTERASMRGGRRSGASTPIGPRTPLLRPILTPNRTFSNHHIPSLLGSPALSRQNSAFSQMRRQLSTDSAHSHFAPSRLSAEPSSYFADATYGGYSEAGLGGLGEEDEEEEEDEEAVLQRLTMRLHDLLAYERLFPPYCPNAAQAGVTSIQDRLDYRDDQIQIIRDLLLACHAVWQERYQAAWNELLEGSGSAPQASSGAGASNARAKGKARARSEEEEQQHQRASSSPARLCEVPDVVAACDHFETYLLGFATAPRRPTASARPDVVDEYEEVLVEVSSLVHSLRYPVHEYFVERIDYLRAISTQRLQPLESLVDEVETFTQRNREGFALRALLEYGISGVQGHDAGDIFGRYGTGGGLPGLPLHPPQPPQQQPQLQFQRVAARNEAMQAAYDNFLRYTLPALLSITPALLMLALKVGIMLWVFVKDMRGMKQYAMLVAAGLWYIYQGVELYKRQRRRLGRRDAAQQPRQAQQNQQQAAQQAQGDEAGAPGGPPGLQRSETQQQREADAQAQADAQPSVAPLAPRRYTTESAWALNWWIEHLAYFGMEEEDVEIGLRVPGRAPLPRARAADERQGWLDVSPRKIGKAVVTALVVFLVCMIPEVEVRRRSAVIDREDLVKRLAKTEHERRERVRAAQQQQQEHQGDVGEVEDDEEEDPRDAIARDHDSPAPLRTAYGKRMMQGVALGAANAGDDGRAAGQGAFGGAGNQGAERRGAGDGLAAPVGGAGGAGGAMMQQRDEEEEDEAWAEGDFGFF